MPQAAVPVWSFQPGVLPGEQPPGIGPSAEAVGQGEPGADACPKFTMEYRITSPTFHGSCARRAGAARTPVPPMISEILIGRPLPPGGCSVVVTAVSALLSGGRGASTAQARCACRLDSEVSAARRSSGSRKSGSFWRGRTAPVLGSHGRGAADRSAAVLPVPVCASPSPRGTLFRKHC